MEFAPYKKQVEALGLGKRLPDATYLHISALALVSEELAEFTSNLAAEYATDLDWNIAKFFRRDFKVSLLSYPTFLDESYPALAGSVTIDLVRKKVRKTDYSKSENPPILHRKETLVAPEHPAHGDFSAITQEGEALGLYGKKRAHRIQEILGPPNFQQGLRVSGWPHRAKSSQHKRPHSWRAG